MAQVRYTNTNDKLLLAIVLLNAGIKARMRVIRDGIRVVFLSTIDREAVAALLNAEGFRFAAGTEFTRFSFDGDQLFVRGVVA